VTVSPQRQANQKAEGARQKAEGGRQKTEGGGILAAFRFLPLE
jgi:hypothetical protein